jgi:hypothetical protein
MATDRQLAFMRTLLAQKGQQMSDAEMRAMPTWVASARIDALLAMPNVAAPASSAPAEAVPSVPAGRYAVLGEDGTTDFYRVDHGKGKWAGVTFVSLLLGSPGGLQESRISRAVKAAVLEKIAKEPEAACARFGHALGICGVCGAPLTNEESREIGIGPVCRARFGG